MGSQKRTVIFSVLTALALITVSSASADDFFVITDLGNTFAVRGAGGSGGGGGNGGGDATGREMAAGLGVSARLVYHDVPGKIIHGSAGESATEESLRPYIRIPDGTEYTAVINDYDADTHVIPKAYNTYALADGDLDRTSVTPNILGYADARTLSGNVTASSTADGIAVSGEGRLILRLTDVAKRIQVEGSAAEGTTFRVVKTPHDLMTLPYDDARGFLISHIQEDPGPTTMNLMAGSVDDSVKSGTFEFVQEASLTVYHGKCCKGRYVQTGSHEISTPAHLIVQAHPSGYHVVRGDTTDPWTMDTNSIKRPGAKTLITHYNRVTDFEHTVYDTLPVRLDGQAMRGSFDAEFDELRDHYLVIDSTRNGQSAISAHAIAGIPFLVIQDIGSDTVYRVTSGEATAVVEKKGTGGPINIASFSTPVQQEDLRLHMYPDALVHTYGDNAAGLLVMDRVNSETFEISGAGHTAYTPPSYVRIPVVAGLSKKISAK